MKSIERKRQSLMSRRTALLIGGQGLLVGALGARLYHLQIQENARYSDLSADNSLNYRLLTPNRGLVVDRFDRIIVNNQKRFSLQLVPEETKGQQVGDVLALLASIVPLEPEAIDLLMERHRAQAKFIPLIVRENLSWEEVAKINLTLYRLPGVRIQEGNLRHYPYGAQLGAVTGYVGRVSPKEQLRDPNNRLYSMPDFRLGKQGIELFYENNLQGESGFTQQMVNAHGRVIRIANTKPSQTGSKLQLTIDADLQNLAYQELNQLESGAAIVLDIQNGAVRCLNSCPYFDPNLFVDGISQKAWTGYLDDPLNPLTNKAISGLYAPGSTFKIVTLMAALKANIPVHKRISCYGHIELGNHRFHCWKKQGHGAMDAMEAMRESCDIWFYQIAREIGMDAIADMAQQLGLGQKTGIDLHGEKAGLVPRPSWKRKAHGSAWYGGETLINAIGQGFVLATPLQLAVMMARFAKGGLPLTPRLYMDEYKTPPSNQLFGIDQAEATPSLLSKVDVAAVMLSLYDAVNHPRGTAYRALNAGNDKAKTVIAGKTGTSQVRRISMAERETGILKGEDVDRKLRDHGLFVGLAPANNPRYAAAVVVEHGGSGSSSAAPIAGKLLRAAVAADLDKA
ncbi:MAG: penicillin-binding protein 2 [Alphaproteobacteria bacterium]